MTEHETFSLLIDNLKSASENAFRMGELRDDMRWKQIGELLNMTKDNVYKLAMQRVGQ